MVRRSLLLSLLFFFPILFSQDIENTQNGYLFHLDSKDIPGLNTNLIYNVVVDKNGFLWVKSNDGIHRFNGRNFETVGWEMGIRDMSHIIRDDIGNVWFINRAKAIKYDGKEYRTFTFPDSVPLRTNEKTIITTAISAESADLLISLYSFGRDTSTFLIKIVNDRQSVIDLTDYKLPSYPVIMSIGKDGNTWLHCKKMVYRRKRMISFKNEQLRLLRIDKKHAVKEYNEIFMKDHQNLKSIQQIDDKTWFIFKNPVLFLYENGKLTQKNDFNKIARHLKIRNVVRINDDLFLNLVSSILHFNSGKWRQIKIPKQQIHGAYLFVQNKELYLFERWQPIAKFFHYGNGNWQLKDIIPFVGSIHAVEGSGFHFIETGLPRPMATLYHPEIRKKIDNPFSSVVADITKDINSNIWIIFFDHLDKKTKKYVAEGIARWNGNTLQTYSRNNGMLSDFVEYIFADSKGKIWVLSPNGISLGSEIDNSYSFETVYQSDRSIFFNNHLESASGDNFFWVRNPLEIMKKANIKKRDLLGKSEENRFQYMKIPESIPLSEIDFMQLHETRKGTLFLTMVISRKDSVINYIYDDKKKLWISTGNKYSNLIPIGEDDIYDYFLDRKVKKIMAFDGIFQEVEGIDDLSILELSNNMPREFHHTQFGLLVQSKDIMIIHHAKARKVDPGAGIEYIFIKEVFEYAEGYIINTWFDDHYFFDGENIYPVSIKADIISSDKKNNMFAIRTYRGIGGISEIFVEEVSDFVPAAYINSLKTDSSFYRIEDQPVIPYEENFITFNVGVKDYIRPSSIYYSYFLEGFDKDWPEFANVSEIRYKNLPEGSFRLAIKTFNYYGQSYNYLSEEFTILPPWYRTWWFYSLNGILFIVLILAGFIVQRNRIRTKMEQKRQHEDLEYGRKVQLSMLPKENIYLPKLEMVGFMQTATEVGGDYYDFIELDNERYAAILGDATGHGVGAGMMVGMVKAILLQTLKNYDQEESINTLMQQFNHTLKNAVSQREMGMCLSIAIIDTVSGVIDISSTGLPYPYHYHANTQVLEQINLTGPPLGLMRTITTQSKMFKLEPEDHLIMLSDGFPERMNPELEMWEYEKLESFLLEAIINSDNCESVIDYMKIKNDEFAKGRENDDDMTMVVIKKTKD